MENKHWYKHPGILKSWLAEELYGNRSRTNTSKLSYKIRTGKWTQEEVEALDRIHRAFYEDIKTRKVKIKN